MKTETAFSCVNQSSCLSDPYLCAVGPCCIFLSEPICWPEESILLSLYSVFKTCLKMCGPSFLIAGL